MMNTPTPEDFKDFLELQVGEAKIETLEDVQDMIMQITVGMTEAHPDNKDGMKQIVKEIIRGIDMVIAVYESEQKDTLDS